MFFVEKYENYLPDTHLYLDLCVSRFSLFISGNKSAESSSSREALVDEDFPSLQEAAMLARGVKIDDQRKRNTNPKQIGNMQSCFLHNRPRGYITFFMLNSAEKILRIFFF